MLHREIASPTRPSFVNPTGLVTPTTIGMRTDLKELKSSGYSWDEVLPDEIQSK